jgi:hypothetical protein
LIADAGEGAPMWYRTRADIAFCKLTSKEGTGVVEGPWDLVLTVQRCLQNESIFLQGTSDDPDEEHGPDQLVV